MQMPNSPIIDTHQHLWDIDKLALPWLKGAGPPLAARHWIEEYNTATEGLDIESAMYMEVDSAADQKMQETRSVLQLIATGESCTRCAILSADPGNNGFRRFADMYRNNGLVLGFRQVLHGGTTPKGYCLESKFIANSRYLAQIGKTFDLCMRPQELSDAAQLAAACPETRFILDHCGNADPKAFFPTTDPRRGEPDHDADQWKRDMASLAKHDNVYCKISGIVARVPQPWSPEDLQPIVQHCAEVFGEERIVFGSDWPVCKLGASLKEWVGALAEIVSTWPASAQSRLWRKNAIAIYNVPAAPKKR